MNKPLTHSTHVTPSALILQNYFKSRLQSSLRPSPSLTLQAQDSMMCLEGPQGSWPPHPVILSLSLLLLDRWVAGPWSPCSATCEKGIQHREVTCVYQLQNGTHVTTRPLYCPGPRPAPVQSCEGQDCLSIWEASEWSQVGAWAALSTGTPTWWFPSMVFLTQTQVSQSLPAPR